MNPVNSVITTPCDHRRSERARPRVAVIVERLGPYHAARLAAAGAVLGERAVLALEIAAESREYAWDRVSSSGFRRRTLVTDADYKDVSARRRRAVTVAALEEEQPEAVAFCGWGFAEARAALAWCRRRARVAVMMSESQAHDAPRSWPREVVKRALLRDVDAALVGGESHAGYLVQLGFPRERIFLGYDVVDNEHFRSGAAAARREATRLRRELGLPERYLLASARFLAKKNLVRLLEGYALHRREGAADSWELVVLGDGPERARIEARRRELGLESVVRLPGFQQYGLLPAYYGLATAFVLPSSAEQWGLVVNEAMASGLPVLVSRRCGSAELVREGVNGYLFDPERAEDIARALDAVARSGSRLAEMGAAAHAAVDRASPRAFAEGLAAAIDRGRVHRAGVRPSLLPNPALWF